MLTILRVVKAYGFRDYDNSMIQKGGTMKSTFVKLAVLIVVLALAVIFVGSVNTTSADVTAQGGPPTVVLPTRAATKLPTLTVTPTKPGVAPQIAATPVAPLKATVTRTPTPIRVINPRSTKSGYTGSWTTSITYQNVGTQNATNIIASFYVAGSGTPYSTNPLSLNAGAGTSMFVGSVSTTPALPASFRGDAVFSSDQPLVSTVVQFVNDPTFRMRILSNGFRDADKSNQYLIATTLLNKFNRTTVFSIQNTESSAINITIRFYDADAGGVLASTINHNNIPAQSSKYIDMGNVADTGLTGRTIFNGSAIVTAVLSSDGTTPANVVAAVHEYYVDSNIAMAFEGVPLSRAANTIYMATALCQRFSLTTYYAVQNASTVAGNNAQITVTYRNTDGTVKATDGPYTIGPGQKRSINTCAPSDSTNMVNFTGSAVITSVGAPIVVIGKAQDGTAGTDPSVAEFFTGFMGEPSGSSKRALPFIRWANDTNFNNANNLGGKQRCTLAVQSLSSGTNKYNVKYYSKTGTLVATEVLTIAQYAKANSSPASAGALGTSGMNPGEFGYYTDGTFGGAVIIEAHADNPSATFIAIVRCQHPGAGEDYNAVPVD